MKSTAINSPGTMPGDENPGDRNAREAADSTPSELGGIMIASDPARHDRPMLIVLL